MLLDFELPEIITYSNSNFRFPSPSHDHDHEVKDPNWKKLDAKARKKSISIFNSIIYRRYDLDGI
jgi:hypothetical protein